ncbi:MAG: phosphate ABC transporter permease subunit PstC [Dysgonamonadaceae bacterium]|jgi:phosphate transport system permease protein|nr:phosphate ABC transporter permease subunit PstC [Dysgonamonadaceae bacterium]
MKDKVLKIMLFCSAVVLLLLMAGILYALISQSIPAFKHFGFFQFISSTEWNQIEGQEQYGALSFITGTILTSLLALIISIPFSVSLSFLIGELFVGKKIAFWINSFLNILAGIPPIILGIWGYYSLRPLLISLNIGHHGYGIFSAAILLSLMIIPYSTSISTTFFALVPMKLKESAYSLGATRFEVIRNISIPYIKKCLIAAHVFALGKVMGETIAVTMIIGNINYIPSKITDTGNTLASVILNQFETISDLKFSALFAIALLLFIITAVINLMARYMIRRVVL